MKRIAKVAAVACAAVWIFALSACGGKADLLGSPKTAVPLSYSERNSLDPAVGTSAERFAASFSDAAFCMYGTDPKQNFVVSPLSVYMALALSAECTAGETREEVVSALGVPYERLRSDFSAFYRSVVMEETSDFGSVTGRILSSGSLWVQKGLPVKEEGVSALAEKYFCYTYSADFRNDNRAANRAVREFVDRQTNGVIDRDFSFSEETLLALLTTLYLKDLWKENGRDLPFDPASRMFARGDGGTQQVRLLRGVARRGRAYDGGTYSLFYASTVNGCKLKFIVPKEGYAVADVFTEETIAQANAVNDFRADDEAAKTHYYTSCLFPEFKAEFDRSVKDVLRGFGVTRLFRDPVLFPDSGCQADGIAGGEIFFTDVRHAAELKVDKKGIEGAAVVTMPAAGAPGPDGWEDVYLDFVVDRAFGFLVTDP